MVYKLLFFLMVCNVCFASGLQKIVALEDKDIPIINNNFRKLEDSISNVGGGGGGSTVSIDGTEEPLPDFVSTGDIDFVLSSPNVTGNVRPDVVEASNFANGNWGELTVSSNVVTVNDNVIPNILYLKTQSDDIEVATGDSIMFFTVPSQLNNKILIDADAVVYTASSSGKPTVQIYNLTDTVDMLSTEITIDVSELTSYTASVPPVIDTSNDDVSTGDRLRVDVDASGTGTEGLDVILVFDNE